MENLNLKRRVLQKRKKRKKQSTVLPAPTKLTRMASLPDATIFLEDMKQYLETNEIPYASSIPFIPPVRLGKVIKVYDGDTITVGCWLPHEWTVGSPPSVPMSRFSVRLNGIDTPEMKDKDPEIKQRAKNAQAFLSSQILNRVVRLENVTLEKYGRLLAEVYLDDVHINQLMIENHHANAYDGGKKEGFSTTK